MSKKISIEDREERQYWTTSPITTTERQYRLFHRVISVLEEKYNYVQTYASVLEELCNYYIINKLNEKPEDVSK